MTGLAAGFALGLLGSGHCALMCGPLVALASQSRTTTARTSSRMAVYHAGRLTMYSAIGVAAGSVSQAASFAGLGRTVALVMGGGLIASALGLALPWFGIAPFSGGAGLGLLRRVGSWLQAHNMRGPFVAGALNGLLPCGLVSAAAAAATGLGDPPQSVVFMLAFGAGTVPVLVAARMSGLALASAAFVRARRLAPVALALAGALLIIRGMTADGGHGQRTPAHAHVDAREIQ